MSASPEAEPQGNTELSQVLASRDAEADDWSSADIAMPHSVPVGVTAGRVECGKTLESFEILQEK
jgi:hypothetical protein